MWWLLVPPVLPSSAPQLSRSGELHHATFYWISSVQRVFGMRCCRSDWPGFVMLFSTLVLLANRVDFIFYIFCFIPPSPPDHLGMHGSRYHFSHGHSKRLYSLRALLRRLHDLPRGQLLLYHSSLWFSYLFLSHIAQFLTYVLHCSSTPCQQLSTPLSRIFLTTTPLRASVTGGGGVTLELHSDQKNYYQQLRRLSAQFNAPSN